MLYKGHEIMEPLVIHKLRDHIHFYTAKPVRSQFHRLISSGLCKTEGVKPPVHLASFLGSEVEAAH